MQEYPPSQDDSRTDQPIRWMMRAVGLSVTSASLFLLTRHVSPARPAGLFVGASAALGALTFVSSWLPHRKKSPDVEDAPLFI